MPDLKKPAVSVHPPLPVIGRGAEPLLNSQQAAQFLGVHPRTLQRMVLRGQIAGIRVGKLWRFLPSSLTEWVQQKMAS